MRPRHTPAGILGGFTVTDKAHERIYLFKQRPRGKLFVGKASVSKHPLCHSGFADEPMRNIEEYVSRMVAELNDAYRQASLGEYDPVVVNFACVIRADEELAEKAKRELEQVRLWIKNHPGE